MIINKRKSDYIILKPMEPWGTAKKGFNLVGQCHRLLSGFPAKGIMPRVSNQSRLSANDKSNNEMIPGIPGAVHRSLGIYLTAKDLQMRSVGSHVRKGGGRKEGKDGVVWFELNNATTNS